MAAFSSISVSKNTVSSGPILPSPSTRASSPSRLAPSSLAAADAESVGALSEWILTARPPANSTRMPETTVPGARAASRADEPVYAQRVGRGRRPPRSGCSGGSGRRRLSSVATACHVDEGRSPIVRSVPGPCRRRRRSRARSAAALRLEGADALEPGCDASPVRAGRRARRPPTAARRRRGRALGTRPRPRCCRAGTIVEVVVRRLTPQRPGQVGQQIAAGSTGSRPSSASAPAARRC